MYYLSLEYKTKIQAEKALADATEILANLVDGDTKTKLQEDIWDLMDLINRFDEEHKEEEK